MTSGPAPDWMAAVVRAWMSLPLIVSTLSVIPKSLAHCWVIWFLSSASDWGIKSFQRNQCRVVPWA